MRIVLTIVCTLVFLSYGCAVTGTFSGKVKNPAGEVVYTFDGDTESSVGIDPPFAESFSIFGLSIAEILAVLGGLGVVGAGGVVTQKKIAKKELNKKKK